MRVRRHRRLVLALTLLVLTAVLGPIAGSAGAEASHGHAAMAPQVRGDIRIESDAQFDRAHGVRSGRGTARSPYLISGWDVRRIWISNTGAHLLIRDNMIDVLILDWNGPHVHVHGNRVGDLAVNRNVERTGSATRGTIAHNTVRLLSQLRHYDGVFEHNTVGNPAGAGGSGRFTDQVALVAGFNGTRFRYNTIYGYVEARLHGHHHGSGFGKPSHAHSSHGAPADHSRRYHELWIHGNTIRSDHAWALRYFDTGHAGNDGTNNSETNRALNRPHIHFTRVHLTGNRLVGSGIRADVFNPADRKHTGTSRGLLEVSGNTIRLRDPQLDPSASRDGIGLLNLHDVNVRLVRNVIEGPSKAPAEPLGVLTGLQQAAGIRVEGVQEGRVWIIDNRVSHRRFGVFALRFDEQVHWVVRRLVTEAVQEPVHYDDSVKNAPTA
ncbi:MAG: hypothetical protein WD770_02670 [Actinomycetota bacterium]